MRNPRVEVSLTELLLLATEEYAADHGLKVGDVLRLTLAKQLSKEGYYRTGGRGWRKGRKEPKALRGDAPADHAATRMVFGGGVGDAS